MCIITMRVCRIRAGAGDPMMNRTIGKNIFGIANEIEAHAWRVSRKFGKVFMAAPTILLSGHRHPSHASLSTCLSDDEYQGCAEPSVLPTACGK